MLNNKIANEFIRYIIVGGTAFIVDITILYIFKNYVFNNLSEIGIYFSTALGFIGGLLYNYVFSLLYVFENGKEKNKGKEISSFIIFTIVGVIGLLFTELGMYVGIDLLAVNYLVVKVVVAGLVLIWNYGARKILIFK